tara:strand:- start:26341 stop:26814 length:474 start_codon:yes stop_codon:yes gene_type:complete
MKHELEVGDKVLNVEYLKYIGVKGQWRSMNMKPFQKITGVGECRPWMKMQMCFTMSHPDVKHLAQIPMHRGKLFDVETGLDVDNKRDQFLPIKTHKEKIKTLINESVQAAIKEKEAYNLSRIERLEREIESIKQEMKDHAEFCNECGDYLLSECEEN